MLFLEDDMNHKSRAGCSHPTGKSVCVLNQRDFIGMHFLLCHTLQWKSTDEYDCIQSFIVIVE